MLFFLSVRPFQVFPTFSIPSKVKNIFTNKTHTNQQKNYTFLHNPLIKSMINILIFLYTVTKINTYISQTFFQTKKQSKFKIENLCECIFFNMKCICTFSFGYMFVFVFNFHASKPIRPRMLNIETTWSGLISYRCMFS